MPPRTTILALALVAGCGEGLLTGTIDLPLEPDTDYALNVTPVDSVVATGSWVRFVLENLGPAHLSYNLCTDAGFEQFANGRWATVVEALLNCPSIGLSLAPGGSGSGARLASVAPGQYRLRVDLRPIQGVAPAVVVRRSAPFLVAQ